MNLSPKPNYTDEEKRRFYGAAAKRFKAELKLYGAMAAIHIENKNDEVFWGKVLRYAYPRAKFRLISSSRNVGGNMTSGCTQCLQYKEFLDEHFWIAIDSDYRYLNQEPEIDAHNYILQTYTYSFENHFCYAENLNEVVRECCGGELTFDFVQFMTEYSRLVYPLLVWQLYLQGASSDAFPQNVFHRMLSLPVGPAVIHRNGASVLAVLKDRARKLRLHLEQLYPEADPTWYEARCHDLGVNKANAYLYVRGHQLYDLVVEIGKRIVNEQKRQNPLTAMQNPSFEHVLLSHLIYGQYIEMDRLISDVRVAGER